MNQSKVQRWIGGATVVMADHTGKSLNAKAAQSSDFTYLLTMPRVTPNNAYLKG